MRNPYPTPDGLETVEHVELSRPLVPVTRAGAAELGRWYWEEVERSTRALVRARAEAAGVRLVLGGSLTLLRFGEPQLCVEGGDVVCRYPILGGFLASRPGGALTVAQRDGSAPQLEVAVTGYHPRLAGRGVEVSSRAPLHRAAGAASPGDQPPLPHPHRRETSMRIAVFGASGVIGSALLPRLAEAHEVVALSRRAREDDGDVRWLVADATDEASLGVLDGMDVAVYLVHSLGSQSFEAVDRAAAENVARAAGRAGLRQIVFLGGLGDDSPELSPHLRSRHETARALASGPSR